MREFIDLVLCKHFDKGNVYLFRAPPFSHLDAGTRVIVETRQCETPAEVVDSITVEDGDAVLQFVVRACGAKLPLTRVLKIIEYKSMEYGDKEAEGETANGQ